MTKKELKLYKLWLDNKVGVNEVARQLGYGSGNSAYRIFADCAKYLHNK